MVFEITQGAERAIRRMREDSAQSQTTSLRIAPVPTIDGDVTIGIAFTEGPEEGDAEVESKPDFRVFISSELASSFERVALQSTSDEEGIEIELRTQADLHDFGGNGDHSLPNMLMARRSL